MRPTLITVAWVRLIRDSDLPHLRFHDLRHAHATHLLASGLHPKVASERLGHSRIGVTLDLYSHVMPGMQEDAVAKVDAALRDLITGSGFDGSQVLAEIGHSQNQNRPLNLVTAMTAMTATAQASTSTITNPIRMRFLVTATRGCFRERSAHVLCSAGTIGVAKR